MEDAKICEEIYADKLFNVRSNNKSEKYDEESDISSDNSKIVTPREKIVRTLLSSKSEFKSSDLNTSEWIPRDKQMFLVPLLGTFGIQKILNNTNYNFQYAGLFIQDELQK